MRSLSKFQPPRFTGLAVHTPQPEVQTKRGLANICLDSTIHQLGLSFEILCRSRVGRAKEYDDTLSEPMSSLKGKGGGKFIYPASAP